ncbi:MAG: hypothetical protein H6Q89_1654 [Myxococcaceae bacterium]|nr:hypothetical protein [Myxococcaceae bacterium]
MQRAAFLAVLALLPGCNGALDGPGSVHDLRLLAMRADPPEQRLGSDAGVTVTALIANPPGGFLVSAKWSTCAEQDSATTRCLETSPGFTRLGESTVKTGPDGAEPAITFGQDPALLELIRQADPYRGLAGLRQVVQVELRAGDETVVGFKRMVFVLPFGVARPPPGPFDAGPPRGPLPQLNTNPVVGPLEFNDAGWAPETTVLFTVPPRRTPGQPPTAPVTARNRLAVLEDPRLREDYVVRTFSGEPRTLQETWRYNFFATHGSFSPVSAGGSNLLGSDGGIEANWGRVEGEDGGSGPTTVWIVVRDGRGGENWTIRHAEAP